MHHAFLYISLPLLHEHNVKMPLFTFYGGRKQATTTSEFPKKSTPGKFAYIRHFQRIGINAIDKVWKTLKSDVFAAVAVVDAKTPLYVKRGAHHTPCLNHFQSFPLTRHSDTGRQRKKNCTTPWKIMTDNQNMNKTSMKQKFLFNTESRVTVCLFVFLAGLAF